MAKWLTNLPSRLLGGSRGLAVPVPQLGAELLGDTTFDGSWWVRDTGVTIGGGTCNWASAAAAAIYKLSIVVAGDWYEARAEVTAHTSGAVRWQLSGANVVGPALSAVGAQVVTLRNMGSNDIAVKSLAAATLSVDNVSLKRITLASMFSTRAAFTHATTKARATVVAGTRAGVVCNLDSATVPANFVVASHDGTTARLTKCVGGTYTELVSQAVAYSAGAFVEIRRIAGTTTFQLWYNGAQVGADQEITDAGIVSNTLAGLFNSYSGNSLTDFSCTQNVDTRSVAWALAGGVNAANLVAAYQPKGAYNLGQSYVNLATPGTLNAAPGVAPTFAAATGWTFNGATQWLTTGYTPPNTQAVTVLVRFNDATNVTTTRCVFGAGSTAGKMLGVLTYLTGNRSYRNGGTVTTTGYVTAGVIGVAGANGYLDGAEDATGMTAWTGDSLYPIYIGARNSDGTAAVFFQGNILAVAVYNSVLTAPQIQAVTTAMLAL